MNSSRELRNGDESDHTLLYLNVYDLTPVNNYVYWCGFGIFHSGIEGMQISRFLQKIIGYRLNWIYTYD